MRVPSVSSQQHLESHTAPSVWTSGLKLCLPPAMLTVLTGPLEAVCARACLCLSWYRKWHGSSRYTGSPRALVQTDQMEPELTVNAGRSVFGDSISCCCCCCWWWWLTTWLPQAELFKDTWEEEKNGSDWSTFIYCWAVFLLQDLFLTLNSV